MANAVKCDGSSAAAQFDFNFSGQTVLYIEAGLIVPAATLAGLSPGSASGSLPPALVAARKTVGGTQNQIRFFTTSGASWDEWQQAESPQPISSVPVGDAVAVCKLFYNNGPGYAEVDGVNVAYTPGTSGQSITKGRFGWTSGSNHGIVWFTYIKVGTTDGGNDILDFDAATASDLSAFTTTGSVTLTAYTPPASVPDAPTVPRAVAGTTSAIVNWVAPASDGGASITNYVITPYIGASAQATTTVGNVLTGTVTGLTNGTAYTFKVAAVNSAGTGPQSTATLVAIPGTSGAGGVRVSVAFDDSTLEPSPAWTDITAGLVAGYEIRRGRQFEFDRTETGTATVTVNDRDGILDPTNSAGPYYTLLEPLRQIMIDLWNPVTSTWHTRYRGFIEDYNYTVAPSTHQEGSSTKGVTRLEISCVDLFEILTAIEMQPGAFGDSGGTPGNVFFDNAGAQARIEQVLGDALIDPAFYVVFTLNVNMQESTYSPSDNVLQVVQDAADAEFPTLSNVYTDKYGRLAVHGRLAKFDPDGTAVGADWDFTHWKCGDQQAVNASISDTAQVRAFSFNRGLSKVFNSALCTPNGIDVYAGTDGSVIAGQLSEDATSKGIYGIRSWSAENLLIGATTNPLLTNPNAGTLTGNNALDECKLFADFIVANYASPQNRITELTFRSMNPTDARAAATWRLLCHVDIADMIDVSIENPGGSNNFNLEPFFVEGVTESCTPLNGQYANVTLSLDVSPQALFSNPSGLWPGH